MVRCFRLSRVPCQPFIFAAQETRRHRRHIAASSVASHEAESAKDVAPMDKISSPSPLLAAALLIWGIVAPAAVHAWVVVIKNQTNDLMSFCYTLPEMGSGRFGSTDVPPNGTATVITGRACAGKWRVTRARDGQVQAFSRPGGVCADSQLIIRPDGLGFALERP